MIQPTEQDHARIVAALDAAKIPPGTLAERVEALAKQLKYANWFIEDLGEMMAERKEEASDEH